MLLRLLLQATLKRFNATFLTHAKTVSLQISALVPCLSFVFHFWLQVSPCSAALGHQGASGLAKTFPDVPSMFHESGRRLWSRLGIPRGLGTWDNLSTAGCSTSWNSLESFIKVSSFSQLLYLRCEFVYSGLTVSQFLPGEFVNSQFLSSFQFFHFLNTSNMCFRSALPLCANSS